MVVSHPSIPPTSPTRPHLAALIGRDVALHTSCGRHCGVLVAVSPHAVWLELRDDCLLAVSEPVLAVTPGPIQAITLDDLDDLEGELRGNLRDDAPVGAPP
jgi:hypothetical protein